MCTHVWISIVLAQKLPQQTYCICDHCQHADQSQGADGEGQCHHTICVCLRDRWRETKKGKCISLHVGYIRFKLQCCACYSECCVPICKYSQMICIYIETETEGQMQRVQWQRTHFFGDLTCHRQLKRKLKTWCLCWYFPPRSHGENVCTDIF